MSDFYDPIFLILTTLSTFGTIGSFVLAYRTWSLKRELESDAAAERRPKVEQETRPQPKQYSSGMPVKAELDLGRVVNIISKETSIEAP